MEGIEKIARRVKTEREIKDIKTARWGAWAIETVQDKREASIKIEIKGGKIEKQASVHYLGNGEGRLKIE